MVCAGPAQAQLSLHDWEADARMQHQPTHSHSSQVTAYDYDSGFGVEPLDLSLHAANTGGFASAETNIHEQSIRSTWTHAVEPGYWYMERSTSLVVEFVADSDMIYSINGYFEAFGDARMSAQVRLMESLSETPLFLHWIDGVGVDPRVDFGSTADFPWYQQQSGSLQGLLYAGVKYRLDIYMDTFGDNADLDEFGGPAISGYGQFNMQLSSVPSPGAPVFLALAGVVALRRRRPSA
jgi:hypothetical protein